MPLQWKNKEENHMAAFPFRTDEGAEKYKALHANEQENALLEGFHNLQVLMPRIMNEYMRNPTDDPYQFISNWYLFHPEYDYDMYILRAGNEPDGKTIKDMKRLTESFTHTVSFEEIRKNPALRKSFAERIGEGLLHLLKQASMPMLPGESKEAADGLAMVLGMAEETTPVLDPVSGDALKLKRENDSNTPEQETPDPKQPEISGRKVSFGDGVQATFNGGEMTVNAGMLLIKKFCKEMKLDRCFYQYFKIQDQRKQEKVDHPYADMVLQVIYMTIAGFYTDASAKTVANDPTFKALLNVSQVASQPSICRMFQHVDQKTVDSLNDVLKAMREIVYALSLPTIVILDLDTTHVNTYGHQEDAAYCTHYQAVGYHPLVLYDSVTRDPIKVELRPGSEYCSKHAADFLRPVFEEFRDKYPSVRIFLRADSGFAAPEIYDLCEDFGVEYIIRLKENPVLCRKFATVEAEMSFKITEDSLKPYLLAAEGTYKAGSWRAERRVVGALDKKAGTFLVDWVFIVTNVAPGQLSTYNVIDAYRHRGIMETFIGECKRSFGILHVSSESFLTNSARFLVHIIAYGIYNWFSRLAGKGIFGSYRSETIRDILFRIPAKVTHSSRYTVFHMAENYQQKDMFFAVYDSIERVAAELREALQNHQGQLMVNLDNSAAA